MPFLASKGYETYSISLRGTSGTPIPGVEVGYVFNIDIACQARCVTVVGFVEYFFMLDNFTAVCAT